MSQQPTLAINQKSLSPEAIIKLICLVYGAYFLYRTYSSIESMVAMIPNLADYGLKGVLLLLFLIITPLSLVLLLTKEKGGWILLMFDIISGLPGFLLFNIKVYFGFYDSNNIIPNHPSLLETLLSLLMFAGMIAGLFRKDVLAMYRISRNNIIAVMIVSLLVFLYMYLF